MDIKLLLCLQFMYWMFIFIDKMKRYNYLKWHIRDLERQLRESIEDCFIEVIEEGL